MNAYALILSVAVAAAFHASSADAQVGGNVTGGLGGAVSGSMRDVGVMGNGALNGSLESQFERGALRRSTRDSLDSLDRTKGGVRDTARRVKHDTGSKIDEAHGATASEASAAANRLNATQIDSATHLAGSGAAEIVSDGMQLAGAADGAVGHATHLQPRPAELDAGVPSTSPASIAPSVPNLDTQNPPSGDEAGTGAIGLPNAASTSPDSNPPRSLNAGTAIGGTTNSESLLGDDESSAPVSSQASGDASGDAAASKRGVSARGSAQGNADSNVAMTR